MDVKIISVGIALLLIAQQATAGENECWEEWYTSQVALQPSGNDIVDQRNGKELSQTPGAKRSRDRKLLARIDELTLRGKGDEKWKVFLPQCLAR